jgi:hypothetical protein
VRFAAYRQKQPLIISTAVRWVLGGAEIPAAGSRGDHLDADCWQSNRAALPALGGRQYNLPSFIPEAASAP